MTLPNPDETTSTPACASSAGACPAVHGRGVGCPARFQRGCATLATLRRIAVLVKDAPSFVVNRVLTRMYDEIGRAIDAGGDPKTVSIQFDDVLDLVLQSSVKVNGLDAGRVTGIALADDGWTAQVEVVINDDVELPSNVEASIQ